MIERTWSLTAAFLLCFSAPAAADMIYKPINPSFGGDPFNSNHLQALANAQNQFSATAKSNSQSNSERFLSMLETRLYSSLASQVADAIFGDNAQQSGTIVFSDQQIAFFNTGTEIQLTITDFSTGQVTNITVPTLTN
jgi:curli production assembly/transport component CsgF